MNISSNSAFHLQLASLDHEKLLGIMLSHMNHAYQFKMFKHDEPSATHAPFTLYPSPFSRPLYQRALELQPIWNELVQKLSQSYDFVDRIVARLLGKDHFVERLYRIEQNRRKIQPPNVPSMAILRSDYMMHRPLSTCDDMQQDSSKGISVHSDLELKQVEINTMASSFGVLSDKLYKIRTLPQVLQYIEPAMGTSSRIPNCSSKSVILDGIIHAINHYNVTHNIHQSIAIMIAQPNEKNFFDQQLLIDELSNLGVTMLRLDFPRAATQLYLDSTLTLRLPENDLPISLVYYRAGYTPSDYPTEQEWKCREIIECSIAIKCPSINTQIVGLKKTQQVLSEAEVLESYLSTNSNISLLRNSFMKLYSLENVTSLSDPLIQMALDNPTDFVLKPQREGGGNNLTNLEMFDYLSDPSHLPELPAYILMEKIRAPRYSNIFIRNSNTAVQTSTISELGIFGSVLWESDRILYQESGGYLLRTKSQDVSEGGVAAGYGFIDSPWLVDPNE